MAVSAQNFLTRRRPTGWPTHSTDHVNASWDVIYINNCILPQESSSESEARGSEGGQDIFCALFNIQIRRDIVNN